MQMSPLLNGIKSDGLQTEVTKWHLHERRWKRRDTFTVEEDNCQMVMFIAFLCHREMCRVRYENYVKYVNSLASIT